ncbi:MAG: hypothetical protein KBH75_09720, partial [Saprospiraceae bacterium]|nr:hypothetical protein [Saprospiraceae bacterium]
SYITSLMPADTALQKECCSWIDECLGYKGNLQDAENSLIDWVQSIREIFRWMEKTPMPDDSRLCVFVESLGF